MSQPNRTPLEALEAVISVAFGGVAARMAEAYRVSDQTVSFWRRGVRKDQSGQERPVRFPAEHCPDAERRTREQGRPVLCEELRPDIAWDVLRMQAGDQRASTKKAEAATARADRRAAAPPRSASRPRAGGREPRGRA